VERVTAAHRDVPLTRAAGYPDGPGPLNAVRPLPTIGVDPGQTWTAAVLRVGDVGEHGWTMGPTDKFGVIARDALNEVDNWDAFRRYVGRLIDALDVLVDYANDRYGEVRIAVEVPHVPIGWQPGSAKKFQRLPMRDWIIPRQVASAVLGQFPEAQVVRPDGHGRRPSSEYPKELRGTRPPEWGPNETPRRERDHERAAYDVAGIGAAMPR
jgi:hypothetical protein